MSRDTKEVKSQGIERFKMTSYDHVNEMAGITFINSDNITKTIQISKMMFREIMADKPWNQKRFGQMPAIQFELRSCLNTYAKGTNDWAIWFDMESNDIIKAKSNR